ncbi:hypothetical protein E4U54_001283 [Claviceps lovelessii]|nr:hypothetical protein E4U54_001283 [Claviceps lovelessii]
MVLKADTCSDANVNCLTRDVWDAYDDDSFKPDVRTSCREAFGPKEPELLDTDPKLVHDMAPHPCDRHMQSSTPDTPMDSGYWTVGTMMASPTAEDTEETRDNGDSGNAARRASPSTVIWIKTRAARGQGSQTTTSNGIGGSILSQPSMSNSALFSSITDQQDVEQRMPALCT